MYRIFVLDKNNDVIPTNIVVNTRRKVSEIAMRLLASPQVVDIVTEYVNVDIEEEDIDELINSIYEW